MANVTALRKTTIKGDIRSLEDLDRISIDKHKTIDSIVSMLEDEFDYTSEIDDAIIASSIMKIETEEDIERLAEIRTICKYIFKRYMLWSGVDQKRKKLILNVILFTVYELFTGDEFTE